MNAVLLASAFIKPSTKAASEPEKITLKFNLLAETIFSPIVVYPAGPSNQAPLPPESAVLNRSAYLLRFLESTMSGYFSAIHGATYIPMSPTFPFSPASTTAPRSTHSFQRPPPQSSITTSIVPASIASYVVGPSSRVV
ncbi:unannotated protein [freshwater metagenome]|uniref:Unannotated protein n=1 Tax=freshwater metagenome TaxID=449393 RepID=A0A6J6LBZ1_9ZZZZ